MIQFKTYSSLPEDGIFIRKKVFMEEQGFKEEFDQKDSSSKHIVLYEDEKAAAVCRFYYDDSFKAYTVGRIAVLKKFRGKGLGAAVLAEAERQIKALGGSKLILAAQVRAADFYKKQGLRPEGDVFSEESCPHIMMVKNLRK